MIFEEWCAKETFYFNNKDDPAKGAILMARRAFDAATIAEARRYANLSVDDLIRACPALANCVRILIAGCLDGNGHAAICEWDKRRGHAVPVDVLTPNVVLSGARAEDSET